MYGKNQLQLERDTQVTCNKNACHVHVHAKFKFCVCLRVLSEVFLLNLNKTIKHVLTIGFTDSG